MDSRESWACLTSAFICKLCVVHVWEHACTCVRVRACSVLYKPVWLSQGCFSRVLCSPRWSGWRQKIITACEPQQRRKDNTGTGFIWLLQRTSCCQLGEKRGWVNSRRDGTITEDEYANYATLYWTSVKSHTSYNKSTQCHTCRCIIANSVCFHNSRKNTIELN